MSLPEEELDRDEGALDEDEPAYTLGARRPDHGDPAARRGAMLTATVVTLACTATLFFAFRREHTGTLMTLTVVGACYLLLGACAGVYLWRTNELRGQLTPVRGDITIGALLAGVLYLLTVVGHWALTSSGSVRHGWVMRLYLAIGDPRITAALHVGIAIMLVAALEELVWRGWVMHVLTAGYGARTGWLASSALYVVAQAGTVYQLRDPAAGANPILPILLVAAGGCGLVWGLVAQRIGRLGPSLFSHALFVWLVVQFPIWRF